MLFEIMIEVKFAKQVGEFLQRVDLKHRVKIIENIELATNNMNSNLLKKLNNEIWEFRTRIQGIHYRILCFWDKRDKDNTVIFCSNGFIKKSNKTALSEITKAKKIHSSYFALM
ncbi:type II toxin-antitoxin system RelE/ParE family toxin [Flavobacterium johnsoniae]|uniref:Phage derived protein Gp49-like n=1 Tax=Flavobacterium johnsoniae TaxID=986 RepID=A0A1M5Q4N3_FLAJO|nr:type II toxin-antitoxin system RelE/ParE family toxin [Flavobacterium johnsoniae]SHH08810.1 Phage derived protein Gp49-like [Flavobacterium johnsoniae]